MKTNTVPDERGMPPPLRQAGAEDITGFFADDHRRIDRALADFHRLADAGRALAALDAFEGMLLRHIQWEETVLFPAFDRKLGAEAQACSGSMRLQHDELKARLAELRSAAGRGGFERRNIEEVLVEALADHNHAEEGFIYPWMDSAFTPGERQELLGALRT